jgi:hypothetical protein
VSFTVRPLGAPVTLSGTRDGRRIPVSRVAVGATGWQPQELPFRLPDAEWEAEREAAIELFAPPDATRQGIRIWLVMPAGQSLLELDDEARESLRALGYLGPE